MFWGCGSLVFCEFGMLVFFLNLGLCEFGVCDFGMLVLFGFVVLGLWDVWMLGLCACVMCLILVYCDIGVLEFWGLMFLDLKML